MGKEIRKGGPEPLQKQKERRTSELRIMKQIPCGKNQANLTMNEKVTSIRTKPHLNIDRKIPVGLGKKERIPT